MTWGQCMLRCLKDTLSWGVLIIIGGSIVAIVQAVGELVAMYGSWAVALETLGAAAIAKIFLVLVGAIALIVVLAAILGCLAHCRSRW